MNLFLKEPQWTDGLTSAGRIRRYGYSDPNGRQALYSTVTAEQNSHGFALRVDPIRQRVFLDFKHRSVGFRTFSVLDQRLTEKHSEAAFVGARSRGKDGAEEFHYRTVVYRARPSLDSFVNLVERRDVMLELRMHIKSTGAARNHGSAFRIRQDRIPLLYSTTVQLRPLQKTGDPE